MKKTTYAFVALMVLAAILRLAGVSYGLPLQLIADEPQYILTGILMAQEKTLRIPQEIANFEQLLYSPPHLIYLFLPFFWILRYIVEVATLVPYFITARLLAVAAGLGTVFLAWLAARRLFPDRKTAPFFAAYFLATSMLAIAGSASARHWPFAALLAMAGFTVLVSAHRSFAPRFLITAAVAGIGMGVNQIVGMLMPLAAAWYVFMEQGSLKRLFSARWLYAGLGIFAGLTALPFVLFSQSMRGVGNKLLPHAPSVVGVATAPIYFLGSLIKSEPVLAVFFIIGLAALWRHQRRFFWIFAGLMLAYIEAFQLLYFFQHRFLGALVPFVALGAGYGAAALWDAAASRLRWKTLLIVALVLPLAVSLRFSQLLLRNDSRLLARAWFEEHAPEGSRVLVWGHLMRLVATRPAIVEKALITSTRGAEERNEYDFPRAPWGRPFHALNLYDVQDESFYDRVAAYTCVRGYDYAILQEGSVFQSERRTPLMQGLVKGAERLVSFGTSDEELSVTATQFDVWPWRLLTISEFGPSVGVWRLNKDDICRGTTPALTLLRGEYDVSAGETRVHRFSFDVPANMQVSVRADKPVMAFVLPEEEFAKAARGEKFHYTLQVEHGFAVVPVKAGRYVIAVSSSGPAARYALDVRADFLKFR